MVPYSHFWYEFLHKFQLSTIPMLLLDQLFWRPFMTWWAMISTGLIAGRKFGDIEKEIRYTFLKVGWWLGRATAGVSCWAARTRSRGSLAHSRARAEHTTHGPPPSLLRVPRVISVLHSPSIYI